jgi:hypothetical protein
VLQSEYVRQSNNALVGTAVDDGKSGSSTKTTAVTGPTHAETASRYAENPRYVDPDENVGSAHTPPATTLTCAQRCCHALASTAPGTLRACA